jgi:6-phosphogluconolactonase (cycloisomerase 2 family)
MKPASSSSHRLQPAQGNNSASVFVPDGSSRDGLARIGETPQPLGLRRWTRYILEFVPLWLVLAALAGWFAYGCALGGPSNCTAGSISGPTTVAVSKQVQLSIVDGCSVSQSSPTWSASPSGYLSVDATGNVTGISATPSGTMVTVTAAVGSTASGGFSATTQLTVTGPTLQSIAVTDADNGVAAVSAGDQFTATGTYSDQSTQSLTSYVTWASSVATVASIQTGGTAGTGSGPGFAGTLAPGDSLITASLSIGSAAVITGSEILTVGTLNSITVTDADKGTAPPSSADQFTATGNYAGGATQNLTTFVTWSSGNTAVASFAGGATAPAGDATIGIDGTSVITATLTAGNTPPVATSGTENLTVVGTAPTLVSIAVNPPSTSIEPGLTQQYTATGTYTSGPNQVLTVGVTWASSNPSSATISSSGLATGVAVGSTTITATVGSISGQGSLVVNAPILQSVSVSPSTATIQVGQTQAYTVTGAYSNQTTAPITTGITWKSNALAVATINGSGVATGVQAGTTTILATVGTLTSPTVTLTVTPATTASVSRYLVDLSNNGIAVDAIVPGTGQLRASNISLIPNASTLYPQGILVNPNGQSIYLAAGLSGSGSEVAQYSISASGMLTAGTSVTNSNWNTTAVMDPQGRFIYVTDFSGDVWAIPLDSSGALGTPVEALTGGTNFALMAIDPTGTYLYSQGQTGLNIVTYQIGSSGTLTTVATTAGPIQPQSLTVAPSGNVLYVMNVYGQISAYSINAGVLTQLANSPFSVSMNGSTEQLTIDPSGSFLYVTEQSTDGLFGFTIGSDGSLTAMQSGNSFSVGQSPNYISVDAGSQFVYVNNRTSGDIWVYSIASRTGLLTNVSEIRTAAFTGQGIVSGTAGLTFTPTALYIANAENSGGTIQQFTIDSATGDLSSLSLPISAGNGPLAIATDPFGLYAYSTASMSDQIFGYDTASTGLSSLAGNPFTAGNGPTGLTTDLSGSFLYATMKTDNSVWLYDLVSGVPTGGAKTVSTFGAGPVFIAPEPTGQYFYVANATTPSIDMYVIDLPGGSLAANGGGTLTKGASQTSIAVDPSGRYAYSADPVGNAVWEYTINPSGVLAVNSTPFQSAGASSAEPGAGSVVVEPTGKYLYATNVSLGQIYAFSIDPSTGLLAPVHTSMSDSEVADPGPLPSQLGVDISGKYLYCVNTPTAGLGTITIYSIDLSTGLLSLVGTETNVPFAAGFALTGTVQ